MPDKQSPNPKPNHIKDLLLLFSVPMSIAIIAAAIIYLPGLFANPKYDFIYATCDDFGCSGAYSVESTSGKITRYKSDSRFLDGESTLRYYDTDTDSTREISFEQARDYQLDGSSRSPDGYNLVNETSSSGFLFWRNSDSGWYLKNGAIKKVIELSAVNSYYSRDIKFIGWIKK